jgi:hypothetical protein
MKKKYSRYYASVFRLEQPHEAGQIVTILWTKEGSYWKVVSWDAEPEDAKPGPAPDTRNSQTAEAPEEHTKADPALLQASHDFLREWLIKRNYVSATSYFSPKSYSCIDATVSSDQPKPSTTPQYLNYMQVAMQTVAQDLERVQHLPDVIEPAATDHPGLKLVSHKGENAYTVVAVPDALAPAMMCQQESEEHPYEPSEAQELKYGDYYGVLFIVRTPGEHPAALSFLWAKDNGQWKIVAYQMVSP